MAFLTDQDGLTIIKTALGFDTLEEFMYYIEHKVLDDSEVKYITVEDQKKLLGVIWEILEGTNINIGDMTIDELLPSQAGMQGRLLATNGTNSFWTDFADSKSVKYSNYEFQLENDEISPGNSKYYGTSVAGVKGWYALPEPELLPTITGNVNKILSNNGSTAIWSTVGNGITSQSGRIDLGGSLSKSTEINTLGNSFVVKDATGYTTLSLQGTSKITSISAGDAADDRALITLHPDNTAIKVDSGDFAVSLRFDKAASSVVFVDNRTTTKGIEYNADYSAEYTNRSLVDKAYVDTAVAASGGGGGAGVTTLAALTDTTISTPLNNQLLVYNNSTGWFNKTMPAVVNTGNYSDLIGTPQNLSDFNNDLDLGGGTTINSLDDIPGVNATNPQDNQYLRYDAANQEYVLTAPPSASISIGSRVTNSLGGALFMADPQENLIQYNNELKFDFGELRLIANKLRISELIGLGTGAVKSTGGNLDDIYEETNLGIYNTINTDPLSLSAYTSGSKAISIPGNFTYYGVGAFKRSAMFRGKAIKTYIKGNYKTNNSPYNIKVTPWTFVTNGTMDFSYVIDLTMPASVTDGIYEIEMYHVCTDGGSSGTMKHYITFKYEDASGNTIIKHFTKQETGLNFSTDTSGDVIIRTVITTESFVDGTTDELKVVYANQHHIN